MLASVVSSQLLQIVILEPTPARGEQLALPSDE